MRTWNEIFLVAAEAVNATESGVAVIHSLEVVDLTAAASACRVLFAVLDRETRLRHAYWNTPTLKDVRATLKILPSLIEDLQISTDATAIADRLKEFALATSVQIRAGGPTAAGWVCPRCGSHDIDEDYTDGAPGGRYYGLLCESCHLYGGFDHGSAEEALWHPPV